MAKTPITIAKSLCLAMNYQYKTHLVINTTQFYGEGGRLIRMYSVKDAYNYQGKYANKELFCTASGVYTCLFMVDLLNAFRGIESEDHGDGYNNVFARKNGQGSIEYMKEVYLENELESESDEADDY